jgi:hypothetical protein
MDRDELLALAKKAERIDPYAWEGGIEVNLRDCQAAVHELKNVLADALRALAAQQPSGNTGDE